LQRLHALDQKNEIILPAERCDRINQIMTHAIGL